MRRHSAFSALMMRLIFWVLITIPFQSYSQSSSAPILDWVKYKGVQHFHYKVKTLTDASKNVIMTGATFTLSGNYDIILTKYNKDGIELWSAIYDGQFGGNDYSTDIVMDSQGNIFVTGALQNGNDIENDYELVLLKYDSNGVLQWEKTYDSTSAGPDLGTSIALDSSNNVYLAGGTASNGTLDYFIAKYNSQGTQQWIKTYDYQNLYDGALKILYRSGNLAVSGISQMAPDPGQPASNKWEIATINLSAANGTILNVKRTGGSGEGLSNLTDFTVDNDGNYYLCGSISNIGNEFDLKVAKLDENLNILWEHEYNNDSNLDDEANGLKVDSFGNVYVTGYTTSQSGDKEIITFKYSANGTQLWMKEYSGAYNGDDIGVGIALDEDQNPIVVATSFEIANSDFLILKYKGTNGNQLWKENFNSAYNGNDEAISISMDDDGSILVTGQSNIGSSLKYLTVKYTERRYIDPYHSEDLPSTKYFKPNSGQLQNTSGNQVSSVKYINDTDWPKSFIQNDIVSFVFTDYDSSLRELILADPLDTTINYNISDSLLRLDMQFEKTKSNNKVTSLDKREYYENYFLGHFDSKRIESFEKLISFEMWNSIDVVFANQSSGLGINFICNPGSQTADVAWKYIGGDSIAVTPDNHLIVYTALGILEYELSQAYEINGSGTEITLNWTPQFTLTNNIVSFQLGSYNPSNSLVIKMSKTSSSAAGGSGSGNLEWSTFYGGSEQEIFRDVTADEEGNGHVVGESQSDNFPVTTGAFQFNHALNTDMIIVKFDQATLDHLWATYYGGENIERFNGIQVDQDGNVIAAGFTNSGDFPRENEIQSSVGNGSGAIVKLNSTGAIRDWATPFGPYDFNSFDDLDLDSEGNVYAVGRSFDDIQLYEQTGTTSYSSGSGTILKVNDEGTPLWSTMFGQNAFCTIKGIAIDENDNKYITGSSRDGAQQIGSNPNYTSTFGGGSSDAYIAKFGDDDNIVWSSWYGGNWKDGGEDIAISQDGKICFVGGTRSYTLPTLNPLPNNNYNAGYDGQTPVSSSDHHGDGFIVEFSENGTRLFATYFGDSEVDACMSVDYDQYNQIYVSGYTTSTEDEWFTPALGNDPELFNQTSNSGLSDGFIATLDQNRDLIWGTLYGGAFGDVAYGLCTTESDKLYLTGWTESPGDAPSGAFPLLNLDGSYFNDQLNVFGSSEGEIGDGFAARFNISHLTATLRLDNSIADESQYLTTYPNPHSGSFSIAMNSSTDAISNISLLSAEGAIVYQKSIVTDNQEVVISVPDLPSGIYILKVVCESGVYSKKIIQL